MKPGERFNPYKCFRNIYIPLGIAASTKLSAAAKLTYGALARGAGPNGSGDLNTGELRDTKKLLQQLELTEKIRCRALKLERIQLEKQEARRGARQRLGRP